MSGLSSVHAAKIARCSVVVLSANRYTSQLVRSLFFGLGMQDVVVASDSVQAVERFQVSRLDLVVADTGASTFDPIDALKSLRGLGDQRQANVPVILLGTLGQSASGMAGLAVQELQKPLSNKEFRQAILRLLLNIEEKPQPGAAQTAAPRTTALLLSGNPYTAQAVRALLLSLGHSDLAVAGTEADAELKLTNGAFDLVIADSGPASFDALAVVESIRARGNAPLAKKPVLLLASNPSANLVERARTAQVKAIATKPLDPGAFSERVRKILSSSSRLGTV